jgi:hypothetical protein
MAPIKAKARLSPLALVSSAAPGRMIETRC